MLCRDRKLHRFKILLKPDLSTASLQVISASELTPYDLKRVFFQSYRICEDTLVSCITNPQCQVHTGLTSNSLMAILQPRCVTYYWGWIRLFVSCPASGKFVLLHEDNTTVVVLDIF